LTIAIIGAYKVPCPHCGAKKGDPCKSSNGGFMRTVVHTERRRAALKAREGSNNGFHARSALHPHARRSSTVVNTRIGEDDQAEVEDQIAEHGST
jgi:hypothetical protein